VNFPVEVPVRWCALDTAVTGVRIGSMRIYASVIIGLLPVCLAGPAAAQELPGNPQAGRTLAVTECAGCHEVKKGVKGAALPEPPGFQSIADNPAMTALALRVFLRTPHSDMPNLILTDQESDDVIAYILGLRHGQ